MNLKIVGLTYATVNEVKSEIMIELSLNVELMITHNDLFSVICYNGDEYYFEKDSIRYEISNS